MSAEQRNLYEEERRAKLAELRDTLHQDPYGRRVDGIIALAAARDQYKPEMGHDGGPIVKVAGRIVLKRDMGKLSFLTLRDESGDLQVALDRKRLDGVDPQLWLVRNQLDLGDQVVIEGPLGQTNKGETSVWATHLSMASKSLLPPPAKYEGLSDIELRYRQRYVDLWSNPEVMRTMKLRIAIIDEVRGFLKSRGFTEVETPMLQPLHGGAAARPFVTHHNALDMRLFMRIAPELYLKRLLVGGFRKVFEINRNFRNEGISPRHNPEFTMLEAYEAYGSWETMADLVEEMICTVAQKVLGTLRIEYPRDAKGHGHPTGHDHGGTAGADAAGADAAEAGSAGTNSAEPDSAGANLSRAGSAGAQPAGHHVTAAEAGLTGDTTKRSSAPNVPGEPVNPAGDVGNGTGEGTGEPKSSAGRSINLNRPWRRVPMADLVHQVVGWTFDKRSIAEDPAALGKALLAYDQDGANALSRKAAGLQLFGEEDRHAARLDAFRHHLLALTPAEQLQELYEKLVEPTLIDPCFVTRVPSVIIPLAKKCPDDPFFADVYELAINGQEISPGYSELNDPDVQAENFRHQVGDKTEQQQVDDDFLTALKYGMPPAGGIGLGIDRLVMLLTGAASIRDVILFPLMRPEA